MQRIHFVACVPVLCAMILDWIQSNPIKPRLERYSFNKVFSQCHSIGMLSRSLCRSRFKVFQGVFFNAGRIWMDSPGGETFHWSASIDPAYRRALWRLTMSGLHKLSHVSQSSEARSTVDRCQGRIPRSFLFSVSCRRMNALHRLWMWFIWRGSGLVSMPDPGLYKVDWSLCPIWVFPHKTGLYSRSGFVRGGLLSMTPPPPHLQPEEWINPSKMAFLPNPLR